MLVWLVVMSSQAVVLTPRRSFVGGSAAALVATPRQARAEELRALLGKRDARVLKKPIFNAVPAAFAYPLWFAGEWEVTMRFSGYELCATKIPKERLVENLDLPGFRKLSIADVADVGKEVTFRKKFDTTAKGKVREDRKFNFNATVDAHLGDDTLVADVALDDDRNPNRVTIKLREGSRNGERIELFTNARRSEGNTDEEDRFFTAESIRQVTFGPPTFSQPGVPRTVIGEYQLFYTYRKLDEDRLRANLLTAVYVEPQDSMFQDAFDETVVVYSHNLDFRRSQASREE